MHGYNCPYLKWPLCLHFFPQAKAILVAIICLENKGATGHGENRVEGLTILTEDCVSTTLRLNAPALGWTK